jgi:hypothetical protein
MPRKNVAGPPLRRTARFAEVLEFRAPLLMTLPQETTQSMGLLATRENPDGTRALG